MVCHGAYKGLAILVEYSRYGRQTTSRQRFHLCDADFYVHGLRMRSWFDI